VLLGCTESSAESVTGSERGAAGGSWEPAGLPAQPCPTFFPPQKLPDIHVDFAAHAPVHLGKSQDAFSFCTFMLTSKKSKPKFRVT